MEYENTKLYITRNGISFQEVKSNDFLDLYRGNNEFQIEISKITDTKSLEECIEGLSIPGSFKKRKKRKAKNQFQPETITLSHFVLRKALEDNIFDDIDRITDLGGGGERYLIYLI